MTAEYLGNGSPRGQLRKWVVRGLMTVVVAIVALGALAVVRNWVYVGKVVEVEQCFNKGAVLLSLDNNQSYIWTPETTTIGSVPRSPGGFVLGKTGLPFFCVVSMDPLVTIPGTAIESMVSSG